MQSEGFKFVKLTENPQIKAFLSKIYSKEFEWDAATKSQFIQLMLQDFLNLKAVIYQKWTHFNEFIRKHSLALTRSLKNHYDQDVREDLNQHIFSNRIKCHDWTFSKYDDSGKSQLAIVEEGMKKELKKTQKPLKIENRSMAGEERNTVTMFEEVYETGSIDLKAEVSPTTSHIIFLVHGFQASKLDMMPLKYCLEAHHNVKVHVSIANSGKTEENLEVMGTKLAYEITKYF